MTSSCADETTVSEGVGLSNSISNLDVSQFLGKVTGNIVNSTMGEKEWFKEDDGEKYYQLV